MSREHSPHSGLLTLNGNLLCSIDTETTGVVAGIHDIAQVTFWPLDNQFAKLKGVDPFYIHIKPKRPENADPDALRVSGLKLVDLMVDGIEAYKAAELFDKWVQGLNLPIHKRISPLGHNWPFERDFLTDWLGHETFGQLIDGRYRDTMVVATQMNDEAEARGDPIPFAKVNLSYLCTKLNVSNIRPHNSLGDAKAQAEVYKRLLLRQFP